MTIKSAKVHEIMSQNLNKDSVTINKLWVVYENDLITKPIKCKVNNFYLNAKVKEFNDESFSYPPRVISFDNNYLS